MNLKKESIIAKPEDKKAEDEFLDMFKKKKAEPKPIPTPAKGSFIKQLQNNQQQAEQEPLTKEIPTAPNVQEQPVIIIPPQQPEQQQLQLQPMAILQPNKTNPPAVQNVPQLGIQIDNQQLQLQQQLQLKHQQFVQQQVQQQLQIEQLQQQLAQQRAAQLNPPQPLIGATHQEQTLSNQQAEKIALKEKLLQVYSFISIDVTKSIN